MCIRDRNYTYNYIFPVAHKSTLITQDEAKYKHFYGATLIQMCIRDSSYTVCTYYQIHTFSLSLSDDIKSQFQVIIFYDRITKFTTRCV